METISNSCMISDNGGITIITSVFETIIAVLSYYKISGVTIQQSARSLTCRINDYIGHPDNCVSTGMLYKNIVLE